MDNKKTSFFRRASDAKPAERPKAMSNDDWTEEAEAKEQAAPDRVFVKPRTRTEGREPYAGHDQDRPSRRSNGYGSERGERSDRPQRAHRGEYDDRMPRGERAPRGERKDFRSEASRRPTEPKEAPENVIFGIHPVREALMAENPIEKIYMRRATQGEYGKISSDGLTEIETLASEQGVNIQWVPSEKLDKLTRRNNHQGVVAVVPPIEYVDISDILDRQPKLLLVLDSVTDVRNFGAIARSAECAGVDAIVIGAKNCAPINGEAMKSSAGALGRIAVARVGSLRNTLRTIQLAGIQLVASTEKGSTPVFEADLTAPAAIVMGSEERGISSDTLKLCDQKIFIPMVGAIESLNVSAAAAVLLFETMRQRMK